MAEITSFRNNALPYPVYGAPWTIVYPLLDEDGDPVTGLTPDPEISKNGDTGANCGTAGAEIPFTTATNKGMYYTPLTGTELTCDIAAITIYSGVTTTQATCITLYPRKLVTLLAGTSAGGDTGYITLPAAGGVNDDTWNGCLCVAIIDGNEEARIITDYTGSNKRAAVTPAWNVAPDNDDTFIIYLPEGMQRPVVDVAAISGDTTAADNCELMFDGTGYAGGAIVFQADVTKWLGQAVHAASEAGTPCVEVVRYGGADVAITTAGIPDVNLIHIVNVDVSATTAQLGVNVVNYANAAAVHTTDGIPDVNVAQWLGTATHAVAVAGLPVVQLHGTGGLGVDAPTNFEDLAIVDTTGIVTAALGDVAHGGGNSTILLESFVISNAGGIGFRVVSGNTDAVSFEGAYSSGSGSGLHLTSVTAGDAFLAECGGLGYSINAPDYIAGDIYGDITGNIIGTLDEVTTLTASQIVDGTVTLDVLLQRLNAYVRGAIDKTGDRYVYMLEDGSTPAFDSEVTATDRIPH